MQKEFEFFITKVYHGVGAARKLGDIVKKVGAKKVMVFHGPNVKAAGLVDPCLKSLEEAGVPYVVYDKVEIESPMHSIEESAALGRSEGVDTCVAIGGGSCMDTAKVARMLITNPGTCRDYTTNIGTELYPNKGAHLICIPTTSGTGSEMTNISVLADTKNGGKKGVVSEYMYADTVILDAELTFGLPPRVTAMTGVDAFVHAMESFCGIAATPITDALNLQAMKLVGANIRQAYANGKNAAARDAMMYASALAGMGFGNTQNGIIHAIGTTLPVECHIPHGLAMSFCAPFSVGFNYIANPEKYAIVADILRGDDRSGCMSVMDRAADVEDAFRDLLNDLDIATGLSNYGVKREDLPACADRAFAAKRLLNNNPRAASRDQILALLEANFEA